ncbi:MAG: hypothetical protein LWW94_11485 [Candidatus Desulfofervidaceae bacterium]|nr:hypothetical protein [Candidatus Desulfofervidaceae bacterium]
MRSSQGEERERPIKPKNFEKGFFRSSSKERDKKFFKEAEKEKFGLGDWFISSIHPIQKNFELWHYKCGENPIAEKISQHIVNLPTHTKITEDYVSRLAQFLRKNRNEIYGSCKNILK